jgi:outer membrane protein assembly factor BamB
LGTPRNSPVIANGRLYIRHGNAMMAYEIKSDSPAATTTDGAGVWPQYPSKQFANDHKGGPSCTPALDLDRGAGRVWFLSRVGQLVCLSAAEGEELWTKSLTEELGAKVPPWGFSGSPFVDLQAVYLDVGRIVAFDRSSGRLLWQTKDYRTAYAT